MLKFALIVSYYFSLGIAAFSLSVKFTLA